MPQKIAGFDVPHIPAPPPGTDGDTYYGFQPGSTLLPAGHTRHQRLRPFDVDTIWDRDIPVPMRDGTILRADVFRPNTTDKVPALMAWSPYGKSGAGMLNLDFMPGHGGIPRSALSGYEKFEAPDPAKWVALGYAIINVDARGTYDSKGDVRCQGVGEGEDGYDAIEHIASLDWCTGDLALVGNSWLAMVQYHIAALQPPHLKCIAPLEGQSDFFREGLCRGGIPSPSFWYAVCHSFRGRGQIEDPAQFMQTQKNWNAYYEDKRADFTKIKVPAYVLASYSTGLHTEGSFRCFEELQTPKWITVHDTQEWHDLYQPQRNGELKAFFDKYLKGVGNGWESTPSVRVSFIGYNQANVVNQVLDQWPPSSTTHKRLYLAPSGSLTEQPPEGTNSVSYEADVPAEQKDDDFEELHFSYTFSEKTYVLGYADAQLSMSCPNSDDFDVYLQLRKANSQGEILRAPCVPLENLNMKPDEVPPINVLQYLGPDGMLRASRRALDEGLSKPHRPVLSLRQSQKVEPGQVVPLSIGIRPGGMIFGPGEQLVLKISGHPMILAEFPQLYGAHKTANTGRHVVHFGTDQASYLDLPIVKL